MKTSLSSFTRGSQLLGHFAFMFAAGMRLPFWVTVITLGGIVSWKLYADLSAHEHYLVLMRLQATLYGFMEFDASKRVAIELLDGGTVLMPWSSVLAWPPVALAWASMIDVAIGGAKTAGLALAPLLALYFWYSRRFGRDAKARRHERGAALVALPLLTEEIEAHNAARRNEQRREIFGPTWPLKARLTSRRELDAAGVYRPYSLAGVPYPWGLEQSHAMLIGTTGTGKTVLLRDLLFQVRERGASAVVFDLTGAFIEAFYDASRDVILNPFDARCPPWSIFDECEDEAEFTTVAEALVPHDGGTSEPFWVQAARMLFVETCMRLRELGRGTNHALAVELMTADLKHVHKLVAGTVADPITAPEAARMAESVRAVFNTNAKALMSLPPLLEGEQTFSVKRWMLGNRAPGSILFLSARYVDMSIARVLLTVWMDSAINTLMTMERTRDPRMWFLLDELGALHRLPALEKGLQTARNYGGAIVLGVHAYAKLRETYGENMANTLASLARTKLILATADRVTATWGSDFIGHAQFKDIDESYSYGYNNVRDAVSMTPRRIVEPLVLPDQIMNLQSLVGYLKYPDGFPAALLKVPLRAYPEQSKGFLKRRPALAPPPPSEAPVEGAGEEDRASEPRASQGSEEQASGDTSGTQASDGGPGLAVNELTGKQVDRAGPKDIAPNAPVDGRAPDVAAVQPVTGPRIGQLSRLLARQDDDSGLTASTPNGRREGGDDTAEQSAARVDGRPKTDALGARREPGMTTPQPAQARGPESQSLRELREGIAVLEPAGGDAGIGD